MTQLADANPTTNPSLRQADVTAAFRAGPHDRIEGGNRRLAYWRFGQGPDVVFVHGWPLSAVTFRKLVPTLSRDFTLHFFDLPGTGHTGYDDTTPIDAASHVAALRTAIDHLGLRRYSLLAHDSGGAIARYVAEGDSRVASMVLGNTEIPGHHPALVKLLVSIARQPLSARAFIASLGIGSIRRSALGFGGCFTDARYVDGEFGDLFVKPLVSSARVAEGHLAFARTLDFDFLDRLSAVHARIAAPVRMVWGPEDPFFPIGKARGMVGQLPRAELVEIAGAKLFAHEDHAEQFGRLAGEHLRKHGG